MKEGAVTAISWLGGVYSKSFLPGLLGDLGLFVLKAVVVLLVLLLLLFLVKLLFALYDRFSGLRGSTHHALAALKTYDSDLALQRLGEIEADLKWLIDCSNEIAADLRQRLYVEQIAYYQRTRSVVVTLVRNLVVDAPSPEMSFFQVIGGKGEIKEEGGKLVFAANVSGTIHCFAIPCSNEHRRFKQNLIPLRQLSPQKPIPRRLVRALFKDYLDIAFHSSSYFGSTRLQAWKYNYLVARASLAEKLIPSTLDFLKTKLRL